MYAVIASGGKQERVEVGSVVDVERLGASEGSSVTLTPVLLVDGDQVLAEPAVLKGARIEGRVVGSSKGPKIRGFTYQAKARRRRRFGHRQGYTRVEITAIESKPKARSSARSEKSGED
jgi:large subunit ribosomal protein L21